MLSGDYSVQVVGLCTDIAVRSLTCHTATGTHMPYRLTQCYLPSDRGDLPAYSGSIYAAAARAITTMTVVNCRGSGIAFSFAFVRGFKILLLELAAFSRPNVDSYDSLRESIRIDSFCKKNRPFDSLVVMQFLH